MSTEITFNASFSAAACDYIKKIIQRDNGIGFRLSVKKTGCSGYSYFPEVIQEINPSDIFFEIEAGINIYIDTKWLHLMEGLKVDFVEEEIAGLKQKRLIFINPKEAGRCGCGESFHIE